MSDSRYGDTRTDIGARSNPRCASATNAVGDQPLQRRQQLGDVGDRVLRLPLVIEELGLADVRVGGDARQNSPPSSSRCASLAGSTGGCSAGGAASDAETTASLLSDDIAPFQRTTNREPSEGSRPSRDGPRRAELDDSPRTCVSNNGSSEPDLTAGSNPPRPCNAGASAHRSGISSAKPNTDTSSPARSGAAQRQMSALR